MHLLKNRNSPDVSCNKDGEPLKDVLGLSILAQKDLHTEECVIETVYAWNGYYYACTEFLECEQCVDMRLQKTNSNP